VPITHPTKAPRNPDTENPVGLIVNSLSSRHNKELKSRGKRDSRRKNPALLMA